MSPQQSHAALGDFGRAVGRAHFVDSMVAKTSGKYGSHQLTPEEDSQRLHTTGRAVRDIGGLILDDDIREAVEVAHTKGNAVSLAGMRLADPIKVEAVFFEAVEALGTAQELISARIRGIYRGSVTNS